MGEYLAKEGYRFRREDRPKECIPCSELAFIPGIQQPALQRTKECIPCSELAFIPGIQQPALQRTKECIPCSELAFIPGIQQPALQRTKEYIPCSGSACVEHTRKVETSSAYPERTSLRAVQGSQPEHTSHDNPSCVIARCRGCAPSCVIATCRGCAPSCVIATCRGCAHVALHIYLSQFGYLPPTVRNRGTIMSEDTMKKAVAEFQAFAGLNITGPPAQWIFQEGVDVNSIPSLQCIVRIAPWTIRPSKQVYKIIESTLRGTKLPPWYPGVVTQSPPWYPGVVTQSPPWYPGIVTQSPSWYPGVVTQSPPWYPGVVTQSLPWYPAGY
uniref:Uncharacterized protein n=1 Tax=Timema cristinae TaxID=61476 RepID=A0A7R9CW32_TIMCR|nr:unnamed protein product [Timema cristinae]